jgi:hypothetical protein
VVESNVQHKEAKGSLVASRLMAVFSSSGEAGGGRLAVIAALAVNTCDRSTVVTLVNTIEARWAIIRATQERMARSAPGLLSLQRATPAPGLAHVIRIRIGLYSTFSAPPASSL